MLRKKDVHGYIFSRYYFDTEGISSLNMYGVELKDENENTNFYTMADAEIRSCSI